MEQILTAFKSDFFGLSNNDDKYENKKSEHCGCVDGDDLFYFDFKRFSDYNMEQYKTDVLNQGLKQTWSAINRYVLNCEAENKFLSIDDFSELYEIGLAVCDKQSKKKCGRYYTPTDVAKVMAKWLESQKGDNVCDVGCGTGKLILAYFETIGREKTIRLIKSGKLYLYDTDAVALDICVTSVLVKYGKDLAPFIHKTNYDFLSDKAVLPSNCKVISNPPYAPISRISDEWSLTRVVSDTKELYAAFMDKILRESLGSVIITPYSFIGGNKFYSLRKELNDYNGFIVSFDNVPGNIFCGKKHGVFNTNTANSVRAAITVVENKPNINGFRLSPLIRFKSEERENLLNTNTLESFVGDEYQIVSNNNPMFCKCAENMLAIWQSWKDKSNKTLFDYVDKYGQFVLSMPNTCRYYTVAAKGTMNRCGQFVLNFGNEDVFNFVYCLINSSFAYWYWRMFDGGVTFQKSLLLDMPVFYDLLTENDKTFFKSVAGEMINEASKYIVTKKNCGIQENIRYPKKYRDRINKRILEILRVDADERIFDSVHANTALEKTNERNTVD